MSDVSVPTRILNTGVEIPCVGFGTYALKGAAGKLGIVSAIRTGYRLLDSAFNYENEGTLGAAIREAGVPREDLIITSKLPGRHHRREDALRTIEESLFRASLDYWDLYLIHWPNPKQGLYGEAWGALVEAQKRGLVRSIGVCNFLPEHLERITRESGVAPAVNQIEIHPYFPQAELIAYDQVHGIATEAWSPLFRGTALLKEPVVVSVGEKHARSAAQVVLRWQVQSGTVPLPKAAHVTRQAENLAIFDFELDTEDMAAIATLAKADGRINQQDPAEYEEF